MTEYSSGDFLRLDTVSLDEIRGLLEATREMKGSPYRDSLSQRSLGMIFQKRSTRTRVSFEAGMTQLDGHAVFLGQDDIQLGRGETVGDTARSLSGYVDGLMARVYSYSDVEALAEHADVPVVNGLSDLNHPCQALADSYTLLEHFGSLDGLEFTWLGDGNNVCHSLLHVLPRFGVDVTVATPQEHSPDTDVVERSRKLAADDGGGTVELTDDAEEAVDGADAVYTDTWVSMGEDGKSEEEFHPYQANTELLSRAADDHVFMHCLPAHRGKEVTDDVVDGSHSVVWRQAENRMHAQKALLEQMLI